MAFSVASVEAFILQSKTAKVDIHREIENFPKTKLEVSQEFKDNIETMGTIINMDGIQYWLFESHLIELIVKKQIIE